MLHKDDNTGPWSKIYTLNMRNHKASKQMLGGWKHAPQKNWFPQVGHDLILPFHICDYHFGWPLLSSFEKELKIQILTKKKKKKSQLHSAALLEAIYLAFRNELPEIAMNKSCLFTIASRQITGTAHINTAWEREKQKPD